MASQEPAVNVDSMSEILLAPLDELQKLSQQLFLSLAPSTSRAPPPPPTEAFLACDASLAAALQAARTHQLNQSIIESLKTEILSLESDLHSVWSELEQGKRELETMIEGGEERLAAIAKAKEASIPYPQLLTYAQNISAFTSAPPNMPDMSVPGQPPPPLFFPPFPNEEKMRRGRLNDEAPLGMLGETHSVGKAPTVSPETKRDAQAHQPLYYRHDHRPQQQVFDLDLDLNPDF